MRELSAFYQPVKKELLFTILSLSLKYFPTSIGDMSYPFRIVSRSTSFSTRDRGVWSVHHPAIFRLLAGQSLGIGEAALSFGHKKSGSQSIRQSPHLLQKLLSSLAVTSL
jgi:hypothetical protein